MIIDQCQTFLLGDVGLKGKGGGPVRPFGTRAGGRPEH